MTWEPSVKSCDQYMDERTGRYEYRAIRYRKAIETMFANGLDDSMTIMDVGAGMTEFDYCLRKEFDWRGRYIPIDGGIDGTDINDWVPNRQVHWIVALELLEHLKLPAMKVGQWRADVSKGIVVSTPDASTLDVVAMDPTHISPLHGYDLERMGFKVSAERFYGGFYGESSFGNDSIFGVYLRSNCG